jgi:hypothetical protein
VSYITGKNEFRMMRNMFGFNRNIVREGWGELNMRNFMFYTSQHLCYGDRHNVDQIDEKKKSAKSVWWGNLKERDHLR